MVEHLIDNRKAGFESSPRTQALSLSNARSINLIPFFRYIVLVKLVNLLKKRCELLKLEVKIVLLQDLLSVARVTGHYVTCDQALPFSH